MPTFRKKQQGAVAIMVGLMLFTLVGMLAFVIDLGHVYLAKTGLQNGADAAALAGAKELRGTAASVAAAKASAIEVARENTYSFGLPVGTASADAGLIIEVGSCQDDGCMEPIDSINTDVLAADKLFLKVDTQQRTLTTWFAGVFGMDQTSTFGLAVAGRVIPEIGPIGICQLPVDPTNPFISPSNPDVSEFGFERGVTYDIADANPIGPGTLFWIDPVATLAGTCDGSVPTSLPYVCSGKINFTPVVGGQVFTNTGVTPPQLLALDSRFGSYPKSAGCDPSTAPSDSNVIEYKFDGTGNQLPVWMGLNAANKNEASDPARQSLKFFPDNKDPRSTAPPNAPPFPVPWGVRTFKDYGLLWSHFRPEIAAGDNTDLAISQRWKTMYKAPPYPADPPPNAVSSYPAVSPYIRDGGNGRRIINMVILDCKSLGGICRPATVLGVGQFFMQRKVDTAQKHVYVEFGGLLDEPFADAEIKLFR